MIIHAYCESAGRFCNERCERLLQICVENALKNSGVIKTRIQGSSLPVAGRGTFGLTPKIYFSFMLQVHARNPPLF